MSLEGIDYLLNKYPGEKIQLDHKDRVDLAKEFLIDLGMMPSLFTLK